MSKPDYIDEIGYLRMDDDEVYFLISVNHPDFFKMGEDGFALPPVEIRHQYGCLCCRQFVFKGRAERARGLDLVYSANKYIFNCDLGCYPDQRSDEMKKRANCESLSRHLGLEVAEILGEGLVKLKDGRYIATGNCD